MTTENLPRTIWWENNAIYLVDQTRLPLQGDILICNSVEGLIIAIQTLALRGAPALGVGGALGVALWSETEGKELRDGEDYFIRCAEVCEKIANARPTAVNLSWGVREIGTLIQENREKSPLQLHDIILARALKMCEEDEAINRAIGAHGATLFADNTKFLTHCNAGSLATVFYGTALGVIYTCAQQGKVEHVWVDETRPVNQGARITAWELMQVGIPHALICDNAAASIMQKGWVDAVIVGADRICANGDTANKIGTYGLAVLACQHNIPFYVAAPRSTFDLTLKGGSEIDIEERDEREILGTTVSGTFDVADERFVRIFDSMTNEGDFQLPMSKGHHMQISRKGGGYSFDAWFKTTPTHVMSYNPAFDVTPAEFITAFICEEGIITPKGKNFEIPLQALLG